MVEILPYFAGFIMILFGIALYSVLSAFREVAKNSESVRTSDKAAADKVAFGKKK